MPSSDLFSAEPKPNQQKPRQMRRIVSIEKPSAKIFVPDVPALSAVHGQRDQRKKRTVLKRKEREAVILLQIDCRLQDYRHRCEQNCSRSAVLPEHIEDHCPCGNHERPIAEVSERDADRDQNQARRFVLFFKQTVECFTQTVNDELMGTRIGFLKIPHLLFVRNKQMSPFCSLGLESY